MFTWSLPAADDTVPDTLVGVIAGMFGALSKQSTEET
jgi:hypothetical protein